jgi:3-phenylpropionate/trans-cinnamate dioxygenase ferredoxin component
MSLLRNDPHGRGVDTGSPFPPVSHDHPVIADGPRLVSLELLGERQVVEVRTEEHGTLAVGMANGEPFAVGNVCRHQGAKLGRGRVTPEGCLECPWHRAHFDVHTGRMVDGPKGRIFGFKPYSAAVRGFGEIARLARHPVELRNGAIWLART